MADDNHNHNIRHPTEMVGEVSTNIQSAREDRLTDLKQLLKMSLAFTSTEAAQAEEYEVTVSIIASE